MDEFQKELIAVFRDEVAESLDELAQLVDSLAEADADAAAEAIDAAFRAAHNAKGAARTVGFDLFEQLAHVVEDALSPWRGGSGVPAEALCGRILRAVTVLERLAGGEELPAEVDEISAEIAACASGGAGAAREFQPAPRGERAEPARTDALADPVPASPPGAAEGSAADGEDLVSPTVRVDVARLDRVMAHVGELLVTHAQQEKRQEGLAELRRSFRELERSLVGGARGPLAEFGDRLAALHELGRKEVKDLGYLTDEISTSMKRLRMLPLANLAAQWRRGRPRGGSAVRPRGTARGGTRRGGGGQARPRRPPGSAHAPPSQRDRARHRRRCDPERRRQAGCRANPCRSHDAGRDGGAHGVR